MNSSSKLLPSRRGPDKQERDLVIQTPQERMIQMVHYQIKEEPGGFLFGKNSGKLMSGKRKINESHNELLLPPFHSGEKTVTLIKG